MQSPFRTLRTSDRQWFGFDLPVVVLMMLILFQPCLASNCAFLRSRMSTSLSAICKRTLQGSPRTPGVPSVRAEMPAGAPAEQKNTCLSRERSTNVSSNKVAPGRARQRDLRRRRKRSRRRRRCRAPEASRRTSTMVLGTSGGVGCGRGVAAVDTSGSTDS